MTTFNRTLLGGFTVVSMAGVAAAAENEVKFDWNSITSEALTDDGEATEFNADSFGGRIEAFDNVNSGLLIFEDENGVPSFQDGNGTIDLEAVLEFDSGDLTGGSIMIAVGEDVYTTEIKDIGSEVQAGGTGFEISGRTVNGEFNNSTFAGIDVEAFVGNPLGGDFINFDYNPQDGGTDTDASFDVFVTPIPLPHPAGMAVVGVGGVALLRRRR